MTCTRQQARETRQKRSTPWRRSPIASLPGARFSAAGARLPAPGGGESARGTRSREPSSALGPDGLVKSRSLVQRAGGFRMQYAICMHARSAVSSNSSPLAAAPALGLGAQSLGLLRGVPLPTREPHVALPVLSYRSVKMDGIGCWLVEMVLQVVCRWLGGRRDAWRTSTT
jgi:hypothetical protein